MQQTTNEKYTNEKQDWKQKFWQQEQEEEILTRIRKEFWWNKNKKEKFWHKEWTQMNKKETAQKG